MSICFSIFLATALASLIASDVHEAAKMSTHVVQNKTLALRLPWGN